MNLNKRECYKFLYAGGFLNSWRTRDATLSARLVTVLCSTIALSACSNGEQISKVSEVRIGARESLLRRSVSCFSFAPNGHFGDKVQYNSRLPDDRGGTYAVHCHKGYCYGIEVRYEHPISESQAHSVLDQLLPLMPRRQSGHDNSDRESGDIKDSVEYFYFDNKTRAELVYAAADKEHIREISVWTE